MAIHAPAANTPAVITVAGVANCKLWPPMIYFSYSAAPTGGNLKIESGGVTIFSVDIISGGPGPLPIDRSIIDAQTTGANLVITLAAGGAGISGKINVPSTLTVTV